MPIPNDVANDRIGRPKFGNVRVFVGELGGAKAYEGDFIPLDGRSYLCDGKVVLADSRTFRGKFHLKADPDALDATNILCFFDGLWYSLDEPELYEAVGLDIAGVRRVECISDRPATDGPLSVKLDIGKDEDISTFIKDRR